MMRVLLEWGLLVLLSWISAFIAFFPFFWFLSLGLNDGTMLTFYQALQVFFPIHIGSFIPVAAVGSLWFFRHRTRLLAEKIQYKELLILSGISYFLCAVIFVAYLWSGPRIILTVLALSVYIGWFPILICFPAFFFVWVLIIQQFGKHHQVSLLEKDSI
jgi:hypothetical protein